MPNPKERVLDGIYFPATVSDFHAHLWLFRYAPLLSIAPGACPLPPTPEASKFWNPQSCYVGEGRFSHARILGEILVPQFEWHDWSIGAMRDYCSEEQVAIAGGGGSSKSTSAALYALLFWLSGIGDTAVVITSTSIDASRRRIWKNISGFYSDMVRKFGRFENSTIIGSPRPQIRSAEKDHVHGLYVVAVKKGSVESAINEIKGYHTARMLLIGDETDSISQAVPDLRSNMRIGTKEFQCIWLGNRPSLLNPLGTLMAPQKGKPVTESLGFEWRSASGIKCRRHDGENSPNLREPGKYNGLIGQRDIDAILKDAGGGPEARNTPTYWVMVKGLEPPDGSANTVLSESLLIRFNCFDGVTWGRGFIAFASLDPAYGGDNCCFRLFKRGLDKDGKMRVLLDSIHQIQINATDPANPAEYQIAAKVRSLCEANGVPPEEFILDSTGIGRGTASVLIREWSPKIEVCEFWGSASEKFVNGDDPRPASEVYDRRVTELWFSIREFVQADMIRGMDQDTAIQLVSRTWDVKNKKKAIQLKEEMPSSPDEADALACAIELLRRKGINATPQGVAINATNEDLEREAGEYDFLESYASEF